MKTKSLASPARRRRNRVAGNAIGLLAGVGMLVFGVDLEMSDWGYLGSRAVVAASGACAIWCVIRLCRRDCAFPLAAVLQIAALWAAYASPVPHWLFFVRHHAALEASRAGGPLPPAVEGRQSVPAAGAAAEGVEWLFPWRPVFGWWNQYAIIYRPGPSGPRLPRHGQERRLAEGWYYTYVAN